MTTQQEERHKEMDYERFRMSEYSVTKKAQEPLPPEAILQVKEDDKDIFGCADCGREFTDGKKRDDHFMSSDCNQQGRYDSTGLLPE